MVTFGIEVIENFDEYNKGIADKKYHLWTPVADAKSFYSGLIKQLKKHHLWIFGMFDDGSGKGHTKINESDLHDSKTGGRDDYMADGVELFIFDSHGNHTKDFHSLVFYKTGKYPKQDEISDPNLVDEENVVTVTPIDRVYEHGFFPLEKSFRVNVGKNYEIFDQWTEILPTDQIVPVEVEYDPKSGRQKDI